MSIDLASGLHLENSSVAIYQSHSQKLELVGTWNLSTKIVDFIDVFFSKLWAF